MTTPTTSTTTTTISMMKNEEGDDETMIIQNHFYMFLLFWSIAWIRTKISSSNSNSSSKDDKNHFCNNHALLDFKNIVGMFIASISLYNGSNNNINTIIHDINDSMVISWFSSFFIIDLFDCIYRADGIYTIHAIISLGLCYLNTIPKYYQLQLASKGSYTELSSIFLTKWKLSKRKSHFQLFCSVFFFCRLVWVPIFFLKAWHEVHLDGFVIYTSGAFYVLQLGFFYKMMNILFCYKEDKEKLKGE
jgi:hypothetical protein